MAKRGRKQLKKKDNIFSANTSNSIICEKCAYLERCGLECCMCECVNVVLAVFAHTSKDNKCKAISAKTSYD